MRGALLRQDAAAWHKPLSLKSLKPEQSNLVNVDLGRPMTGEEAPDGDRSHGKGRRHGLVQPDRDPTGFRFLNNAAESGINNKTFQQAVDTALQDSSFPKLDAQPGYADSGYLKNDWKEQNHGEGYLAAAARTGRPDVQRAAAELLATLGPRVSQIEEDFAHRLGWTPNRDTRVWETSPVIQQHAGAVIRHRPNPGK